MDARRFILFLVSTCRLCQAAHEDDISALKEVHIAVGWTDIERPAESSAFAADSSGVSRAVSLGSIVVVDYSQGRAAFPGLEQLWVGISHSLHNSGHNVTVLFVAPAMEASGAITAAVQRYSGLGWTFQRLPDPDQVYSAAISTQLSYSLCEFLLKRQDDFQLAYFTDWQGLGYFTAAAKQQGLGFQNLVLAVLLTGPRIWHAAQAGGQHQLGSLADLQVSFMERGLVERADIAITPNRALVHFLRRHGWALPNRLYQAPLPLPPYRGGAPEAREVEGVGGGVQEVVYVGALEYRKGLPLFCDAILKLLKGQWKAAEEEALRANSSGSTAGGGATTFTLQQVTFIGPDGSVMAGGGKLPGISSSLSIAGSEYVRRQGEQWRQWQPSLRVRCLHQLDTNGLVQYLQKADGVRRLAVLASSGDSSGFTLAELLRARAPLVAVESGGTPEMVALEDRATTALQHGPRRRVDGAAIVPVLARSRGGLVRPRPLLCTALGSLYGPESSPAPRPRAAAEHQAEAGAQAWHNWHSKLAAAQVSIDPLRETREGRSRQSPETWQWEESAAPHVTVVLAHYNRAHLVTQALDSLASQTYPASKLQ
ncbi:hypothetical protein CYMTET_26231, partial [Cymbomonas tetramitiformis]